jgi:hypothetical protein
MFLEVTKIIYQEFNEYNSMTNHTWNMQYNMTSLLLDTQVSYKQQKLFDLNILPFGNLAVKSRHLFLF